MLFKYNKVFGFFVSVVVLLLVSLISFPKINLLLASSHTDDVTITGAVPLSGDNFSHGIKTNSTSPHNQNKEIEYEIFYSSNISYDVSNVVVVAEWTPGIIEGSGNSEVEIAKYISNSATSINSNPPIIDIINNTITWNIPVIPEGETGSLFFSLKTTENYTGPNSVFFDVKSRIVFSGYNKQKTLEQEYRYIEPAPVPTPTPTPHDGGNPTPTPTPQGGGNPTPTPTPHDGVNPTPTPTPQDGSNPTPTPTPQDNDDPAPTSIPSKQDNSDSSPTPTPQQENLKIDTVHLNSLSSTDAEIHVLINKDAVVDILYGDNTSNLSEKIKSFSKNKNHVFELPNLLPNTNYFFKVIAYSDGKKVTSDLYTFKTPVESEVPSVISDSLIVTSKNNSIQNAKVEKRANSNTVVIPKSEEFSLMFELENSENIKSVSVVRRERVLGVTTVRARTLEVNETKAVEILPGLYIARHLSPNNPGISDIYAVIKDHHGNIVEKKLTELQTVEPIKVINEKTKEELEYAKISLYHYNQKTNLYEFVDPYFFDIPNPSYTLIDGTADLVLPIGKYKAIVEEIGFNTEEVEFQIDANSESTYPVIALEKKKFSILNTIKYYGFVLNKDISQIHQIIDSDFSPRRLTGYFHFQFTVSLLLVGFYIGIDVLLRKNKKTSILITEKYYYLSKITNSIYMRITELSIFLSMLITAFAIHQLELRNVILHLFLFPILLKVWIKTAYKK